MRTYGNRKRSKILATGKKRNRKNSVRTAKVPIAIKAYVNKMNARGEETKQQNFSDRTTLLTYNAATFTLRTLDFNNVIGLVTNGAGEGQRIGNKIKVTSLSIRGWLSMATNYYTTGPSPQPLIVKMYVGRLKQALTNPNASTLYQRLYDNGNTSAPPQNDYFDVLRTPNKDLFMIYKTQIFKIGFSNGNPTTPIGNNDFKLLCPFSLNLNKHIGNLNFDDAVSSPTNQAIYIWFTCVLADGSATPATVPPFVNLCYDMDVKYKDA